MYLRYSGKLEFSYVEIRSSTSAFQRYNFNSRQKYSTFFALHWLKKCCRLVGRGLVGVLVTNLTSFLEISTNYGGEWVGVSKRLLCDGGLKRRGRSPLSSLFMRYG